MEDVTKGVAPFIKEMPAIVVEGREYKMRRLGILDVWRFARILRNAGTHGMSAIVDVVRSTRMDERQAGMYAVLLGLIDQEKELLEWVADLIGTNYETISNPNEFPIDAVAEIIEKITSHPDLMAFFEKLGNVTKNSKMMEKLSKMSGNAQLTESKQDTRG